MEVSSGWLEPKVQPVAEPVDRSLAFALKVKESHYSVGRGGTCSDMQVSKHAVLAAWTTIEGGQGRPIKMLEI